MAKSHLLESFLSASKSVRSTGGGTKETSYYTAINNLLDGVGHTLKPKVRCVMQLKNLVQAIQMVACSPPTSLTAKLAKPKTWASLQEALSKSKRQPSL